MSTTTVVTRVPAGRLGCLLTTRVLQSYLDGELYGTSRREVGRHLERCRRCGLQAATYRAIKASLARQRRPPDGAARAGLRLPTEGPAGGEAGSGRS